MKKYIKFLIIALLVVAMVTLTCFLFFNNYKKRKVDEVELCKVYSGETRIDFNKSFNTTVNEIVNKDGSDNRFAVIGKTLNNLDSSMQFLSSYFVEDDYIVKSNEVSSLVGSVNSSVNLANSMMYEIDIKAYIRNKDGDIESDNTFYNRHLGANDLYECSAELVVDYAKLIKEVGNCVDFNKDLDVRFSVVELYADVVIDAFSNLKQDVTLSEISNYNNINLMNSVMIWEGSKLKLSATTSMFNSDVFNFIECYNNCNKTELAKNINSIYLNISEVVNPNAEQRAVVYFKEVFGI